MQIANDKLEHKTASVPGSSKLGGIIENAFILQCRIVDDVWRRTDKLLSVPAEDEFTVELAPLPASATSLARNIFSTLFLSVLEALGVEPGRRFVYGMLNQLFRVWVTSADNLLDNEDKEVLPLRMPGRSQIMRQVVAIMAGDRIMRDILRDAEKSAILTAEQADTLAAASLQALLPAAAEEGSEEGGIDGFIPPERILNKLHMHKTASLFHLCFLGPELIESGLKPEQILELKQAMTELGLGCQLLDDIFDAHTDLIEKRANYLLSLAARDNHLRQKLESIAKKTEATDLCDAVTLVGQELVDDVRRDAWQRIQKALTLLGEHGVTGLQNAAPVIIQLLSQQLKVEFLP